MYSNAGDAPICRNDWCGLSLSLSNTHILSLSLCPPLPLYIFQQFTLARALGQYICRRTGGKTRVWPSTQQMAECLGEGFRSKVCDGGDVSMLQNTVTKRSATCEEEKAKGIVPWAAWPYTLPKGTKRRRECQPPYSSDKDYSLFTLSEDNFLMYSKNMYIFTGHYRNTTALKLAIFHGHAVWGEMFPTSSKGHAMSIEGECLCLTFHFEPTRPSP